MRDELEQYMSEHPCPTCKGKRLKDEVLAVTVGGMSISYFTDLSVTEIARKLGFCDQSYFSACFKKKYGNYPSIYRNNAEKNENIPE